MLMDTPNRYTAIWFTEKNPVHPLPPPSYPISHTLRWANPQQGPSDRLKIRSASQRPKRIQKMPTTVPAEPCLALQEDSGDGSGCRTRLEPFLATRAELRGPRLKQGCPDGGTRPQRMSLGPLLLTPQAALKCTLFIQRSRAGYQHPDRYFTLSRPHTIPQILRSLREASIVRGQ